MGKSIISSAEVRKRIIDAGVKQLRDFGYPKASADNILTDAVYRQFMRRQLENTAEEMPGTSVVAECQKLLKEMEAADVD